MSKMREFIFDDGNETKTIEALSYKKAVKSYQSSSKANHVRVEWCAKKGVVHEIVQPLPMGRSKRLGR
jgi:hypothetical protein